MDQRLALDGMQRNIAAFGGNLAKVTIAGESSRASSVDRLVTLPPHPIPFRGAITESGQATVSSGGSDNNVTAWNALVKDLKCSTSPSIRSCVRAADPFVIQKIVNTTALQFHPVTDNITQLATPINRKLHKKVLYMTSTNGQEGRVFLADDVNSNNITSFLGREGLGKEPGLEIAIEKAYPIPNAGNDSVYDVESQIYTEFIFQCPAAVVSNESVAAGYPTWRYHYNASFPNINFTTALASIHLANLNLEATHTSKLPLVFGTYPRTDATAPEIALNKNMQTAWASF